MASADEYQVGGSHYKNNEFQHWNLVATIPLDYFVGNTTKYVCRWRKKNGLNDIKKALHYLNKLMELSPTPAARHLSYKEIVTEVGRFSDANKFSDLERAYVRGLCTWQTKEDLMAAREILFLLMDEAEALEKGAKPVPLPEENHYSERYPGA